jgi:hypothetical protein
MAHSAETLHFAKVLGRQGAKSPPICSSIPRTEKKSRSSSSARAGRPLPPLCSVTTDRVSPATRRRGLWPAAAYLQLAQRLPHSPSIQPSAARSPSCPRTIFDWRTKPTIDPIFLTYGHVREKKLFFDLLMTLVGNLMAYLRTKSELKVWHRTSLLL